MGPEGCWRLEEWRWSKWVLCLWSNCGMLSQLYHLVLNIIIGRLWGQYRASERHLFLIHVLVARIKVEQLQEVDIVVVGDDGDGCCYCCCLQEKKGWLWLLLLLWRGVGVVMIGDYCVVVVVLVVVAIRN